MRHLQAVDAAPKRRWTDEEIGFLADHPEWSARQVGQALGRGMQSVQHMRNKLRDGWAPTKEAWSEEEIDFVRSTPHLTAEQVSKHLARSVSAILNRRGWLTRSEGISFDGNKSPHWIGGRPLLAKTCAKCGYFLGAEWWLRIKGTNSGGEGGWASTCTRCRSAETVKWLRDNRTEAQQANRAASARTAEARLQALSQEHAHRHREPWLDADHAVLSNPDLLCIEKALSLGRTYSATRTMCSKNGYKSRVGLGDPERGQWVIDNPNAPQAVA